ncbi:hypothetical protein FCM35_KLT05005 [Carex littledalei]|uniref:Uncharacterized protein n=1 Tax=Carex littledalei TaxID=544730 RepID=A0A833R4W4_9POAL|nr:hypothetical protein FCM35_KLT05005 [Carex littledalei]
MRAADPLQAEAYAMTRALQLVLDRYMTKEGVKITLLSDCQTLIKAVQSNSVEELPVWTAAQTVAECGHLFSQLRAGLTIQKTTRKAIQDPHNLANWARRTGTSFTGTVAEVPELNFTIRASLNRDDFQLQTLHPPEAAEESTSTQG